MTQLIAVPNTFSPLAVSDNKEVYFHAFSTAFKNIEPKERPLIDANALVQSSQKMGWSDSALKKEEEEEEKRRDNLNELSKKYPTLYSSTKAIYIYSWTDEPAQYLLQQH